ncbi:unnamed protein product [Adineta ricciae]|uniref:Peptidase C1A papain C-terminal domain-containing protein n=1 Tax=Adineta ricciae TaxID=249248 RepID=A0A814CUZ1_ADIRI|nr:unnamed protein product [Adineta ricciae]
MPVKTFLTSQASNSKFRVNGLIPSPRLPEKRQLCQSFREHLVYAPEQLPPKVDLRADMTPVEDQSQIGSCAANCLAGAYEYLTKKAHGRNIDVSRLFIYYNARVKDQRSHVVVDSGCTMTSAIEALEELGTCLESVWPYDISRVNTRPNAQSYDEAKRHKITEALRVNINLYEMKSCLAQGFPFAFGLKLYTSFDQARSTGVVPMPNYGDIGRQAHGSHALLAVGYSDQSRAFIVRNSWGEQWGDKGYCYIPYDYITDANQCFDVWAVRKVAADNFSQDNWDIFDVINLVRKKINNRHAKHIPNESGRMVKYDVDDDADNSNNNQGNDYDQSWYSYGNNISPGTDENNNYDQENSFSESWNSYHAYRNDTFSTGGYNNSSRKDSFEYNWSPYQSYRGNHFSGSYKKNSYYNSFENNPPFASSNQFQSNNNTFNFPDAFPNANQFTVGAVPPASYPGYEQYGLSYGYSPPFNNYQNPYF